MESPEGSNDLYSLLKLGRDATEEEIHRAYKALSTTFHPDKLPPQTAQERREQIQQVFLEFKRAHDILIDPVCRMAYNYYGEDGVALIRRIQQQRRQSHTRREAAVDVDDDEDDEGDDNVEANLYERVERLLVTDPIQARKELQRFMDQHDYHQRLLDENQIQLACSMEFPPVVDLKGLFYDGRDYLQYIQKRTFAQHGISPEDREYYALRIKEEQRLVDYQINRIRDSQKAAVGFTLASMQPHNASAMTGGTRVQPKWSMAWGASTSFIYPEVTKMVTLAGKEEPEREHPASTFVNMVYQPIPDSQINLTANLSNNQSHQFVLSSSRTLANRTAFRYSMTFLNKSPLDTNLIMNLKSFRHIKNVGMTSGGVSLGGDGRVLQWNTKWEATQGTINLHKYSAKVSVGMLNGNSLELGYKFRFRKSSWLEEYMNLPRRIELSAVYGRFPKIMGMVSQEITSLATHPSLGFGMEHDLTLGCWTWIWELTYQNSTFRIPIPVLQLGSVSNPGAFYSQKFYHGLYCLLLQSTVAGLLQDEEDKKQSEEKPNSFANIAAELAIEKTKADADRQIAMMEKVAERKRLLESKRDGLVIIQATYWVNTQTSSANVQGRFLSMDATKQLQFWVSNGKLSLPSIPKASLLGFYNLVPTQDPRNSKHMRWDWQAWRAWMRGSSNPGNVQAEPQLTVRYSHTGYVYEISVGETESLILPSERSQLLGHSSLVQ